jgi:antitoxin CcdA
MEALMPSTREDVRPALQRKATNVTLPEALLKEARELGINLSQACERGLAASVAEARAQRWLKDNREALNAWNEYVEQHGLPLAEFRQF